MFLSLVLMDVLTGLDSYNPNLETRSLASLAWLKKMSSFIASFVDLGRTLVFLSYSSQILISLFKQNNETSPH